MELLKSASLLFILLNPFLVSVYLISLIRELSLREFFSIMARAHLISAVAFILFDIACEAIFEYVLLVRVASFLVIGGILFLMIG